MFILPAQWYGHRSGLQSLKLTFEIDETVEIGDFNPAKIKSGTQFLLMLIPWSEVEKDEWKTETKDEIKARFLRHFHARLDELAKLDGRQATEIKEEIKNKLKADKKIKESTKELDINGLAFAIYLVEKQINERT